MKFIGLISGGKDSIYTICKLIESGHTLQALLYIKSTTDTIDSFMYQTVGKEIIKYFKYCLDVQLYIHKTKCRAVNINLEYSETENDEVEDLFNGLKFVLTQVDFDAVSSGAIASIYQKNRVENVCKRLNLISLAPLFRRNQKELLDEMIDYGMDARIIKVAGGDLSKEAINRDLKYIKKFYESSKFSDVNYCGEGGEYETIVVDCPVFKKKIEILKYEIKNHPEEVDKVENVFFMQIFEAEVKDK